MCMKFRTFSKKGWVSYPNYFRYYCFRKRLLLKRLEGLPSEHLPQYSEFFATTSIAIIWKTVCFFRTFYCISEMCMEFRTFWKKGCVSYPNYLRNYCFRKILLLKRLEGLPSEHHSVINLLTGFKHRWKMQRITNIVFSNEFSVNGVSKSLLYSDLKS